MKKTTHKSRNYNRNPWEKQERKIVKNMAPKYKQKANESYQNS